MKSIVLLFACLASVIPVAREEASASEWGCEVLLCAASSNRSWQSIASCRPPMEKLISATMQRKPKSSSIERGCAPFDLPSVRCLNRISCGRTWNRICCSRKNRDQEKRRRRNEL